MTSFEILAAAAQVDGPPIADLAEAVFRGPIAEAGGEVREPQIRMAREVGARIEAEQPIAVEAPTGTGKSAAYLVAGILAVFRARQRKEDGADKRTLVVSTANIALQRQIVGKDVPMVARALGIEVRVATLKGRSNYACLQAIDDMAILDRGGEDARRVRDWIEGGGSGDRDDLPFALSRGGWGKLSVSSEECVGNACPHVADCVANKVRKAQEGASVVVANHSYLALAGARLSKDAVAFVLDEGHELEDAIRRARSRDVRPGTGKHWRKILDRALPGLMSTGGRGGPVGRVIDEAVQSMIATAERACGRYGDATRLHPGWSGLDVDDATRAVFEAADALDKISKERAGDEPLGAARAGKQATQLRGLGWRMRRAISPDSEWVAWAEVRDGAPSVHVAPVEAKVGLQGRPIVMTSATLGAGEPARAAAGVGVDCEGLVLPSPWPLERMAACLVPVGPEPNDAGWPRWCEEQAVAFVQACGGGVLVLATSYARARALRAALDGATPYPTRMQGDAGRTELLAWYAAERDGVLVGTRSLFQGVDVPGKRGVVVDRIPFPSPSDPVEEAVGERLKNAFAERSVPMAAQLLRQAAGRLIRCATDRGAVLLLDGRILTANFAAPLRRALSPIPITTDPEDLGRLARGEPLQAAVDVQPKKPTATVRSARRKAS